MMASVCALSCGQKNQWKTGKTPSFFSLNCLSLEPRYSIRNFCLLMPYGGGGCYSWFILHRWPLAGNPFGMSSYISSFCFCTGLFECRILYWFYQPKLVSDCSDRGLLGVLPSCFVIEVDFASFFPGDVSYIEFVTIPYPIRFGFSFRFFPPSVL